MLKLLLDGDRKWLKLVYFNCFTCLDIFKISLRSYIYRVSHICIMSFLSLLIMVVGTLLSEIFDLFRPRRMIEGR